VRAKAHRSANVKCFSSPLAGVLTHLRDMAKQQQQQQRQHHQLQEFIIVKSISRMLF
jgi:cytochrome b